MTDSKNKKELEIFISGKVEMEDILKAIIVEKQDSFISDLPLESFPAGEDLQLMISELKIMSEKMMTSFLVPEALIKPAPPKFVIISSSPENRSPFYDNFMEMQNKNQQCNFILPELPFSNFERKISKRLYQSLATESISEKRYEEDDLTGLPYGKQQAKIWAHKYSTKIKRRK